MDFNSLNTPITSQTVLYASIKRNESLVATQET